MEDSANSFSAVEGSLKAKLRRASIKVKALAGFAAQADPANKVAPADAPKPPGGGARRMSAVAMFAREAVIHATSR